MRHRNAGYKLGRNTSHRRALLRNLVTSILLEDRVETTITKAKAARPHVEKLITLGKRGDLHSRRHGALAICRPGRRSPGCSIPWRRVTATAMVAICASCAPAFRRATGRRRHSSNCSAPSTSWMRSARSAPKHGRSVAKRSTRRCLRTRHPMAAAAAPTLRVCRRFRGKGHHSPGSGKACPPRSVRAY